MVGCVINRFLVGLLFCNRGRDVVWAGCINFDTLRWCVMVVVNVFRLLAVLSRKGVHRVGVLKYGRVDGRFMPQAYPSRRSFSHYTSTGELKSSDPFTKAEAVRKLTYLNMLGYSISWAAFSIVEVMSMPRLV